MTEGYRVKGSSLKSKFDFVAERFGEEAAASLKEQFRDDGLELILGPQWYPFELYDRLLQEIARRFFSGDLSRLAEVGEFSAKKALSSTYSAFAQAGEFRQFLGRIAVLHSKFYNQGEMQVELAADGRSCEIRVTAPVCTASDYHVARGFYVGAARLLGLEDVRARSQLEETEFHFELKWS